ncbi:MAG: XrtA/PEP-CTERM system exopolysaccharide export protein [Gammaproteobacteria bacterium]
MKQFCTRLLLIGVVALVAGCAGIGSSSLPPESDTTNTGPSVLVESYQLAVGDQIRIDVWKNPELSVTEPVRPDGKIAVPLVGDLEAAGKTPEQLASDITRKLATYIVNPNVTVILTDLKGQEFLSRIRVTGSVAQNISITYHQGMTVLDAVLEAGSVNMYADANDTKLYRRTETGAVSYNIRLKDILENGDMRTNVMLMPGDVITVPERLF